jgi:hypothetical protein
MRRYKRTGSPLDKEYFFILPPYGEKAERTPNLSPDADTATKPYYAELLPIGGKPLIFYNGFADLQKERGTLRNSPPGPLLFATLDLVVREEIANKLWDLEPSIPNLAIQPAIYIDHKDKWYENYWFLTFMTSLDCWDRKNSDYNSDAFGLPGMYKYLIHSYSLNEKMLEEMPLSERRLFKMGAALRDFIVVHKSLADLFRVGDAVLVSVEGYPDEWTDSD